MRFFCAKKCTKMIIIRLKRKIEDTLIQWKNTTEHKPLVIIMLAERASC